MTENQINLMRAKTDKKRAEIEAKKAETDTRRQKQELGLGAINTLTGLIGQITKGKVKSRPNDPSWYNLNPSLVRDVASFAFGQPAGTKVDVFSGIDVGYYADNTSTTELTSVERKVGSNTMLPSVMVLNYRNTLGSNARSDAVGSDAINIASKQLYSWVRQANSGARNYEHQDLTMYMLAYTEAVQFHAMLCKVYSLAHSYSQYNYAYGREILRLMNFDLDGDRSVCKNLAEFRYEINKFGQALNAFYIPGNWPLLKRKVWLATVITKDADVNKAQLYTFFNPYFGLFQVGKPGVNAPNEASMINYLSMDTNDYDVYDVDTIKINIQDILDSLFNNADIAIMSGDINKAFGINGVWRTDMIAADFEIEPSYNPEVLSQINNATVVGRFYSSYCANIYQDVGSGLIYQGRIMAAADSSRAEDIKRRGLYLNKIANKPVGLVPNIINMYKDEVTPDDMMVATRFKAYFEDVETVGGSGTSVAHYPIITTCGTEVITTVVWNLFDVLSTNNRQATYTTNGYYPILFGDKAMAAIGSYITFDWAPILTVYTGQASFCPGTLDVANWTVFSEGNARAMHSVAVQSLVGIPLLVGNR